MLKDHMEGKCGSPVPSLRLPEAATCVLCSLAVAERCSSVENQRSLKSRISHLNGSTPLCVCRVTVNTDRRHLEDNAELDFLCHSEGCVNLWFLTWEIDSSFIQQRLAEHVLCFRS